MSSATVDPEQLDLAQVDAIKLVATHPAVLARMTKVIAPQKAREDSEATELLIGVPSPFVLWPSQLEILHALRQRRRIIILKARQLGVTWVMALYALWYVMAHPAAEVSIISIGEREARSVVKRIRFLYENIRPAAVRDAYPLSGNPTLESFSIWHPDGASTITSLPSTSTAARGETNNVVLMDEGDHWDHANDRMASILPTFADIGQGVLNSTANGIGGRFYDTWENAPENGWYPIFHGALARPDRTIEWVMAERERLGDKGPQEYPLEAEEAFISSGHCVFDVPRLKEIQKHVARPERHVAKIERDRMGVRFALDEKGPWRIWRFRETGRTYLITADVCGGPGAVDWSVAGVWDIWSWNLCAVYRGKPDPERYADELMRAGYLYHGHAGPALLAPEANNDGRSVLTTLRAKGYPAIWRQVELDQRREARVIQHGWLTSARTRPIMLGALKRAVSDGSMSVVDKTAISEMLSFEENPKTQREEARQGCHDDYVMMSAMAAVILAREVARLRPPDETTRAVSEDELRPYRQPSNPRTGY